jgi:hypothetical protein
VTGKPTFTEDELKEFDALTWRMGSRDQVARISARMDMNKFVKTHGKEKCDAMWAVLSSDHRGTE